MPRFHKVDNVVVQFTAEEETARDAEEKLWVEKQVELAKTQYKRDRKAEYPTIEELVVALYDTQDRAEIDKRRADIKKKYPKE